MRAPVPFVLAAVAALAGCGGGGGGPKSPTSPDGGGGNGGGGNGGETPTESRAAAIQAVEARFKALAAQHVEGDAFDAAIKAAMQANPAYVAVTVDADSHTVAGRFADGRIHMVVHNLELGRQAGTSAPSLAARDVHLPNTKQARVLHSFGDLEETQAPVTDVKGWLAARKYSVLGGNGDATLPVLRRVQGDGFFYINSHGGRCDFTNNVAALYCIQSSTQASPQTDADATNRDDLENGRLTYMTASTGYALPNGDDEVQTRYAITPAFVAKYWSFVPNSIVYLNACNSGDTRNVLGAQRFVDALHKKGAGVVFGWSRVLGTGAAYDSIRYFADRLLGMNLYQPETPAQRPFDWRLVYADMKAKGHADDPHKGAQLIAFPNPGQPTPQALTPTIERMLVDERQDRLVLLGGFGDVRGKVAIDGIDAPVASWANGRVEVVLPLAGKGSCGPVQAFVDDRPSNARNLTQWSLTAPCKYEKPGFAGLAVTGPMTLRFRGDVGEYRTKPGEKPVSHVLWAMPTRDSHLPFVASGTVSQGGATFKWSGTRDFRSPHDPQYSRTVLLVRLKIDPAQRTGKLGLALGIDDQSDGFTETVSAAGQTYSNQFAAGFGLMEGPQPFEDPAEGQGVPAIPIAACSLSFANDWTLNPKTVRDTLGMTVAIPATAPEFGPKWEQPRAR